MEMEKNCILYIYRKTLLIITNTTEKKGLKIQKQWEKNIEIWNKDEKKSKNTSNNYKYL